MQRSPKGTQLSRTGFRINGARYGFSLVELTVTMLVLGIIAAIALPRLNRSLSDYKVEAAAARVAADLALAQKHARSIGSSETVTFDVTGSRYSFSSIADPTTPSAPYEVDLSTYPYEAKLSYASFASGASVTLNGYGFPNSSGKIAITCGGRTRTLKLDAASGNVSIGGSSP